MRKPISKLLLSAAVVGLIAGGASAKIAKAEGTLVAKNHKKGKNHCKGAHCKGEKAKKAADAKKMDKEGGHGCEGPNGCHQEAEADQD